MPIPHPLHDLDVRLQRRNLRSGKIEQAQIDEHLADLPDDAEECVESDIRFERKFQDRRVDEEAEQDD